MPTDQNGSWSGISLHGLVHTILEVLLEWRILDNRHHQFLVIPQITLQCGAVNALRNDGLNYGETKRNGWTSELRSIQFDQLTITLIISKCVQRNSFPGHNNVAITALGEWVWITAPASRWRNGNMNNGVHWLFFSLKIPFRWMVWLVEAPKMESLLFVIGRKLNVFPVDALNEEILRKNPLLLDARWSNINFIANWTEWTENSSINFEKDLASTKTLCNNWVLSVQHCN